VFYKEYRKEDPTANVETNKDSSILEMPKKFYTFHSARDIASTNPVDGFTLAQCLFLIFEKALFV